MSATSVVLTTKATGTDQNGAITLSLVTTKVKAAPASLSGGAGTTYDTGTVTANINGIPVTTGYGQSSTLQTLAQALASAISGSGAGLTATPGASGALTISANQTGTTDNGLSVTLSSVTNQPKFFSSASFSGTSGTLSGGVGGSTAGPLYQYTIPASGAPLGYDAHGNLLSYSDCVNNNCATSDCLNHSCGVGIWSANYDNPNRVSGASASAGPWSGLGMGWTYDSFGNRKTQTLTGNPPAGVPQSQSLNYPSQNRISNFGSSGYDAAGNVTYDLINQYAYDAEGRVCAVVYHSGMTTAYMVYIYDAEGRRVAKGSNPIFSCSPAATGFQIQETYLLGQSGEQVTELDGSGAFLRSHVYADGHLLATYENNTTQFAFNDWLGSKRLVAGPLGQVTGSCINLPFGDDLTCSSNVPLDGHHFTGQIHDKESGNDYFGARYFSNYTGRFMSPDWSRLPVAVPYADINNPQSLNLYSYVKNNPLSHADADGHVQLCGQTTTSTDANGDTVVNANCVDLPDPPTFLQTVQNSYKSAVVDPWNARIAAHAPPASASNNNNFGAEEILQAMMAVAGAGRISSKYDTSITRSGSVTNVDTDVTVKEAGENLEANGYTKSAASDGTPLYTKGDTQYAIYPKASSTGGPSAEVRINNEPVAKIRLQP